MKWCRSLNISEKNLKIFRNNPHLNPDLCTSTLQLWRILPQLQPHLRLFATVCYGKALRHHSSFEYLKPVLIHVLSWDASDCMPRKTTICYYKFIPSAHLHWTGWMNGWLARFHLPYDPSYRIIFWLLIEFLMIVWDATSAHVELGSPRFRYLCCNRYLFGHHLFEPCLLVLTAGKPYVLYFYFQDPGAHGIDLWRNLKEWGTIVILFSLLLYLFLCLSFFPSTFFQPYFFYLFANL